jgi:uncharacterized membrane protein YphA (DoxX/SURF4 family)
VEGLYSKFPAGRVGLALLLLRLIDAVGLMGEGIHLSVPAEVSLELTGVLLGLVLVVSAIMLVLGLRTSVAATLAAICTAGAALYGIPQLHVPGSDMSAWLSLFMLVLFLSSALALLGPGGYSLDARLSGWRQLTLSSRKQNRPSEWDTWA